MTDTHTAPTELHAALATWAAEWRTADSADSTAVAVRLTDMLGEEVLVQLRLGSAQ